MQQSPTCRSAGFAVILALAAMTAAHAHPGSSIVVDAQGQVYFVDTGEGVWKIDTQGRLTLLHSVAYHWMALDEKGHFAKAALGEWDSESFERVTAPGALPALILSSGYPIAVGRDGGLYYVPYNPDLPRELVRRTADGRRTVFATLPADGGRPMWVNGIATGPDGSLYVTDNNAIRKVDRKGNVTAFRDGIQAPDCADPLPKTPQLPYLRDLAVAGDGTIYAAANGCRAVIQVPAKGRIRTVLQAKPPWSPTGIAISGKDIYVLEYLHIPTEDRRAWIPRVRKVAAGGAITILATIERRTP